MTAIEKDYAALGLAVLTWYAVVRDAKDDIRLTIERGSVLANSMDDMLALWGNPNAKPPSGTIVAKP